MKHTDATTVVEADDPDPSYRFGAHPTSEDPDA